METPVVPTNPSQRSKSRRLLNFAFGNKKNKYVPEVNKNENIRESKEIGDTPHPYPNPAAGEKKKKSSIVFFNAADNTLIPPETPQSISTPKTSVLCKETNDLLAFTYEGSTSTPVAQTGGMPPRVLKSILKTNPTPSPHPKSVRFNINKDDEKIKARKRLPKTVVEEIEKLQPEGDTSIQYECQFCSAKLDSVECVVEHIEGFHQIFGFDLFWCHDCGRGFTKEDERNAHLAEHKRGNELDQNQLPEIDTSVVFLAEVHPAEKQPKRKQRYVTKCTRCERSLRRYKRMVGKLENEPIDECTENKNPEACEENTENLRQRCSDCGKNFKVRYVLRNKK